MPKEKITQNAAGHMVIETPEGTLVEKKKKLPGKYEKWCARTAQKVCDYITEGKTIADIGKLKSMPSKKTIYYWRRNYPEFKKASDAAREDRAEYFADKVVEVADGLTTKSKAPVAKVKIEAYRWRAGVDNPKQYGRANTSSGEVGPTTIIINTGIPMREVIDVESDGNSDGLQATEASTGTSPEVEEI